jgi:hypothetical protein
MCNLIYMLGLHPERVEAIERLCTQTISQRLPAARLPVEND